MSNPKDSEMMLVATSMDSASSLSSVPFFCESCRNLTMEAARRRVVGFVFPLILVLFEGNVVVNGNTEDVEDHTQLTWVPWRVSCPRIYRAHGIDLKGLRWLAG